MIFTSLGFAVFLTIVFLLHWALPRRWRWVLLLAASIWFYLGWSPAFLLTLGYAVAVSYAAGLAIESAATARGKKAALTVSVCLSLCPLLIFKYLGFFSSTAASALALLSVPVQPVTLRLLQPVGISFYTFQIVSYEADVYRGRVKAERHPGIYALFVCFFPQVVSGPIGRAEALIPQLRAGRDFDYDRAARGLKRIVWGLFKKMVIADPLAAYVNAVYADLSGCGGFAMVLAVLLFAVEIYCDFSGYSDIAVGCGKLLGVELTENFKSPFFSDSIRQFWSRWHISLSNWFRDYVYIPLGGNRVSTARRDWNLLLIFLLSGLWHGAAWTFVIWGGLHGLLRVAEEHLGLSRNHARTRAGHLLRVLGMFLFNVLAWIFFRADTLSDALYVFTHMFSGLGDPAAYLQAGAAYAAAHLPIGKKLLAASLALLTAYDLASLRMDVMDWLDRRPAWLRWGLYLLVGMLTLLCHYHGNVSFIYFQF